MSTTRPLASEITGTSSAISGKTDPVTSSSAGASYASALTRGNWSGLSTETRLISPVVTTLDVGGAPSPFSCLLLQAVTVNAGTINRVMNRRVFEQRLASVCPIIGSPHVLQQDSVGPQPLNTRRSVGHTPAAPRDSRFVR